MLHSCSKGHLALAPWPVYRGRVPTESVLLIDDDAPARAYLERQLTEDSFAVLSAAEIRDAYALAESESPDVVLLGAR